jgi:hypothetical protein
MEKYDTAMMPSFIPPLFPNQIKAKAKVKKSEQIRSQRGHWPRVVSGGTQLETSLSFFLTI